MAWMSRVLILFHQRMGDQEAGGPRELPWTHPVTSLGVDLTAEASWHLRTMARTDAF